MFIRSMPSWVAILLIAGVVGCGKSGPETAPVSGKVTVDGKVVAGAAVMFLPIAGGRPATGVTDAEGVFRLETFKDFDGAVLGDHTVTVSLPETGGGPGTKTAEGITISGTSEPAAAPASTGYEKYAKPAESGLKATVSRQTAPLTFDLKPAK